MSVQRRPPRKPADAEVGSFLSGKRKKAVDEAEKILHNLVSLLLMQQRRKRRAVTQ
jgi:hypothetical protein